VGRGTKQWRDKSQVSVKVCTVGSSLRIAESVSDGDPDDHSQIIAYIAHYIKTSTEIHSSILRFYRKGRPSLTTAAGEQNSTLRTSPNTRTGAEIERGKPNQKICRVSLSPADTFDENALGTKPQFQASDEICCPGSDATQRPSLLLPEGN